MDTATYKARVYCKNCDFRGDLQIKKGEKIDESICPNCGTAEIMKDSEPVSYF